MTTVLGIVSYGSGCAEKYQFGYYSRVNQVLPWIWNVIRHTETDTCATYAGEGDAVNVSDCPSGATDVWIRGTTLHLVIIFCACTFLNSIHII